MSQAVAERIETAPAIAEPTDTATALISMIERVALNPAVDIDKMERLLEMQERLVARDAEQVFNTALNAAQAEMGRISTDANNPQTRSKYATYGKLDMVLRPIYTKHGFALSFDTGMDAPADMVRVIARVTHSGGFTRSYHADMPADGKGAKGGDVMTKTHATGAAMTYGMRYLLKMIFNVAIGEEDRDGNAPVDDRAINDQQRQELSDLIDAVAADEAKFFSFFKIEFLADLPSRRFAEAKAMLEAKRARK